MFPQMECNTCKRPAWKHTTGLGAMALVSGMDYAGIHLEYSNDRAGRGAILEALNSSIHSVVGINRKNMWCIANAVAVFKGSEHCTHLYIKCTGHRDAPKREAKQEGQRNTRTGSCKCHAGIIFKWVPSKTSVALTSCFIASVNAIHCGHLDPRVIAPHLTATTSLSSDARAQILRAFVQGGRSLSRKSALHIASDVSKHGVLGGQVDYLRRVALKQAEDASMDKLISDPTLCVKPSDVSTQDGTDSQKLFNSLRRFALDKEFPGFKFIAEFGNVTLHALMRYTHAHVHTHAHTYMHARAQVHTHMHNVHARHQLHVQRT